ncbi:MAG TPA: adenosine deaminase, partial [Janthinobacterium sp.]|nr:adenosine deaminase [Janthinobacterium sp.]
VEVVANNGVYRELLQRWSSKDFYNHGALQSPPDAQFFDTFGYFNPVSSTNTREGLLQLKARAIQENLSYIETMFERAPSTLDADFDRDIGQAGVDLQARMAALAAKLDGDAAFRQGVTDYIANVKASSAGVDDARFTMRYQSYVLRLLSPSQVFSSMLSGFQIASQSDQVVGLNIVGAENSGVAMRDYALHMQMFKFLKAKYPKVKLALHAGELALGMVPPEGLSFHIHDAVDVAGASRIGHGNDLAHETDALGLMKTMRERGIAVEINLTSNEFILGMSKEDHPLTLYRKFGVPFVISTDDAGVSRNNLSNEYVLFASRYPTNYGEVKKLSYDSLRYSFLAEGDKKRLIKALDGRFAAFEADIAASGKAISKR